jgi:hypothetical protein
MADGLRAWLEALDVVAPHAARYAIPVALVVSRERIAMTDKGPCGQLIVGTQQCSDCDWLAEPPTYACYKCAYRDKSESAQCDSCWECTRPTEFMPVADSDNAGTTTKQEKP